VSQPARALAVAVVIARNDGRVLLIKRGEGRPAAGYWTPVTGRPHPDESLEETARREVAEEVGLRIELGEEVHRCPAEGVPFDLVWLEARVLGDADALRLHPEEIADARWVTLADAARLEPMFAATRDFYERRGRARSHAARTSNPSLPKRGT
jgi:8-oxo-dGTP pyrophosphatase MutT (NUDIX family)